LYKKKKKKKKGGGGSGIWIQAVMYDLHYVNVNATNAK